MLRSVMYARRRILGMYLSFNLPRPDNARDGHRGRGSVSDPSRSLELKLSPGGKRTHELNVTGWLREEGPRYRLSAVRLSLRTLQRGQLDRP